METPRPRTNLEGILSLNYDSCSIVASEASMLAHERLDSSSEQRELHIFDGCGGTIPTKLPVSVLRNIVIYQDPDRDSLKGTNRLRTLPYRNQDAELVVARPDGQANGAADPILLVVTRDDLALPVATFARRKNGNCSYVQLGQEMDDDNFVVTPVDDRKDIVEQIRSSFKNKKGEIGPALASFLLEQFEQKSELVPEHLAGALCRKAERLYRSDMSKTQSSAFWLLNSEDSVLSNIEFVSLAKPVNWTKRPAGLYLGKEFQKGRLPFMRQFTSGLRLYAATRGNVALPVLDFAGDQVIDSQSNQPINLAATDQLWQILDYKCRLIGAKEAYTDDDTGQTYRKNEHRVNDYLESVEKYFTKFLGEPFSKTEYLIRTLGLLANRRMLSGIYKGAKIINDSGDVDVFVSLKASDPKKASNSKKFTLDLDVRPTSMPDFGTERLYNGLEIDKTKKIPLDEPDIEELCGILTSVSGVKQ